MRSDSSKYLPGERQWDTAGVLLDEDLPAKAGVLDFAAIFGNARPVEMEIGAGKGTFLLARAAARPEINFVGVEWARAYCHYTADRFKRAGLTNVRMIRTDAAELVKTHIAAESLWRLHIYFPDPWPKKRHHRRRLIQPPFIDHVRRILKLGGELIVVTDHLDYFYQIRRLLGDAAGFASIPFPKMTGGEDELVGTNFERKYIAQGRPFYSIARMRYQASRPAMAHGLI